MMLQARVCPQGTARAGAARPVAPIGLGPLRMMTPLSRKPAVVVQAQQQEDDSRMFRRTVGGSGLIAALGPGVRRSSSLRVR